MNIIIELILSLLVIAGAAFVLLGSFGLIKLPDFYTRLHAPTKATTLGMGLLLIASLILTSITQGTLSFHQLLITLFLFITAPVTAHMLAKSALHLDIQSAASTRNAQLKERAKRRMPPEETD